MEFTIRVAEPEDKHYAEAICKLIAESAKARGTGIAERKPEYVATKIDNGNAVIALQGDQLAGFCYIEVWSHEKYVANSGLIVAPEFRKHGLARAIKKRIFQLSRDKFPAAKVFGITTSLAVMRVNSDLGYRPVTFSELTQDEAFWAGCKSCPNYDILERNERRMCLCTAMLAPSKEEVEMAHDLSHMIVKQ
ncbi:GNAT family N-acetyltransferase [Flavilitoribacter nigricans]|uniref:GNAT family N-acetyltransferase n=1 Tax=Flavilitoribacter nigricans (strain ATCC 23147 / DSM 23189 / NBRC 102662 / NCIMB 1420 / SS-2) TaxID=1122177 RepID=A0A2D0ND14_FLAN2|nr:GNAT family N-acetyltransferase [Flavilitoribacter nigricans]PHN05663.1 GNAT family N-acetyltransferase [Flavilitoribacter nigricans DSM 23189 = NBRC 102662]